ncbi:DUF3560 domain-containing protein [Streptomyces candidus]|uniref:DUF3560 domain-containing protein n=1 Tax=Streptomyces candidus TaxID=67283 RepID=A0A7X0HKJ3_9ACTN|nr:DUF3560 domain-containing protein [Streptomyces candidus]MBB6439382.1 hypothetical protein [Streptomyces candidus]GHH54962.1 hypothetical protein GCM10018773_58750 [Streptomyces candidus]
MTENPAKDALTITHTRADGTILTGSRKGDGVFEIVRHHGFWFSRNVDGLYIRRSQDKEADMWRINRAAEALRAAGHEVTIEIDEDRRRSFAEAEAAREERADERADRFSDRAGRAVASADGRRAAADQLSQRFEGGQPILVGHHSEGRARRDAARIDNNMRKSFEDRDRAGYWSDRTRAAENYAAYRNDPHRTLRRLEKLRADLRGQERHHAEAVEKGYSSVDRHARNIQDYTEEIAYWEAIVEKAKAEGVKVWGPGDFAPGDFVRYLGDWYEVVRVNPKSLSVAWNLRLAPKQVMSAEDATFDGGRVGTHTADYTKVRARCPGEAMRAFLADGKVPTLRGAREASEATPASAVREALAAKPKPKKKRSDPKIPKRVKVECRWNATEATLTWLNGNNQPHKAHQPVTITAPDGVKFTDSVWSKPLLAEVAALLATAGYAYSGGGWSGGPGRGLVRAIEPAPAAEPEPPAVEEEPPAAAPAPEPVEHQEQAEQAPAVEERAPAAETCPMCHSSRWDPEARVCAHCYHSPTVRPTGAPPAAEGQEAQAMVLIVSKNTRRARKRALWAMTRREAQAVCGDSRTSGRSYILTFSDNPGIEGADWEWVPDNGSLDPVLEDLGITPRREWAAVPAGAAAGTE